MTTDNSTPQTPETESAEIESDIEIVDVRATSADDAPSIDDDEVRQKFVELMEAIERRAKAEAGNVSDWRVQAVETAKATLEQTEQFARDRQTELEESVKTLQGDALDKWQSLTKEAEDFTNRLQKAANEAWKIVMDEERENTATGQETNGVDRPDTLDSSDSDSSNDSNAA